MIAEGQTFKNIQVQLDGSTFRGCTFEACILLFSGLMPVSLDNNSFNDCRWEFTGSAALAVGFMTALYAGGGRDIIERTFQSIRAGGGGRRTGDPVVLN